MPEMKFFNRKVDNLEDYKSNFLKSIEMIKTVKLFNLESIEFLEKWIDNQKSYIPRDDVDNLLFNMQLIFKDEKFYKEVKNNLKQIKNNSNILEYSFNLISEIDELSMNYNNIKKKNNFEEKLEKDKTKSKEKDEEEITKLLDEI